MNDEERMRNQDESKQELIEVLNRIQYWLTNEDIAECLKEVLEAEEIEDVKNHLC